MQRCDVCCEQQWACDRHQVHWLNPNGLCPFSDYVTVCHMCYVKYSADVRQNGYPRLRGIDKVLRRIRSQPALGGRPFEVWDAHNPDNRGLAIPKSDWCLGGCRDKLSGGYLDVIPRDIVGIIAEYVTIGRMRWLPANRVLSVRCLYLCDDCWRAELLGH